MKESDWKTFKVIKAQALDELCKRTLEKADEIISGDSTNYHERYLALYQHIKKDDKALSSAFDGHSRSKATLQLMFFRNLGLVSDEALSKLSTEMQKASEPF